MLRRVTLGSSRPAAATAATSASVSSLFASFRFCATATPTDPEAARRMEQVAAKRRAEEASKSAAAPPPPPRHFERTIGKNTEPSTGSRSSAATAGSQQAAPAAAVDAASGIGPIPAGLDEAALQRIRERRRREQEQEQNTATTAGRHFERTVGAASATASAAGKSGGSQGEATPTSDSTAAPEPKSSAGASTESAGNTNAQASQDAQEFNRASALANNSNERGTSVMFDVPEGELPRQQGDYDPWKILGLKAGASAHDLRVRYHELLEIYHPDYVKDGDGDVQRWADIDRAYQLITKAPTLDKKYRKLITDREYFYYKWLPEWMSKNIDETPRWWSWVRWRFRSIGYIVFMLIVAWIIGVISKRRPILAQMCVAAVVIDFCFHTAIFPVMLGVTCVGTFFTGTEYNLAWLTSPRQFLRRPLQF